MSSDFPSFAPLSENLINCSSFNRHDPFKAANHALFHSKTETQKTKVKKVITNSVDSNEKPKRVALAGTEEPPYIRSVAG
jgi:hypothetical protein